MENCSKCDRLSDYALKPSCTRHLGVGGPSGRRMAPPTVPVDYSHRTPLSDPQFLPYLMVLKLLSPRFGRLGFRHDRGG